MTQTQKNDLNLDYRNANITHQEMTVLRLLVQEGFFWADDSTADWAQVDQDALIELQAMGMIWVHGEGNRARFKPTPMGKARARMHDAELAARRSAK